MNKYGLISDTHGLLHDDIFRIFEDVQAILHAGDVGGYELLEKLALLAPVYAIAGNCDPVCAELPESRIVDLPFGKVGLAHGHHFSPSRDVKVKQLLNEFEHEKVRVIATGHSHLQALELRQEIFVVNPGAACKPRFSTRPGVCVLSWNGENDVLDFHFRGFSWKKVEDK